MKKLFTLFLLIFSISLSIASYAALKIEIFQDEASETAEAETKEKVRKRTVVTTTTTAEESKVEETSAAVAETTAAVTETQPVQQTTAAPVYQNPIYTQEYQALLTQYMELAQKQAQLQQDLIKVNNIQNYSTDQGYWTHEGDYWVFYDNTGSKVTSSFMDYNGATYYLDYYGYMVVGWKFIDHYWYLFDKNGAMIKGWWNDGSDNWYYLDPLTGRMADKDRYIDGQLYMFNSSGLWVKDPNSYEASELAKYVKSLIKYVESSSDLKKNVAAPQELKKEVNRIIDSLPKKILASLAGGNMKHIYICVNQQTQAKPYIRAVSYTDEDGERETIYVPYGVDKNKMVIDLSEDAQMIYYAIGEWLGRNARYLGEVTYNSSVWKSIASPKLQTIEELLSLDGDRGLPFYYGDPAVTLGCTIGWLLMDPFNLQEACPSAYRFVSQFIDISYPEVFDVQDNTDGVMKYIIASDNK